MAVNYRLLPKVEIGDCIDDAAAAVAWAFKHVSEYGGNPRRIFVAGHSAGGYLTDMIVLKKDYLQHYNVDVRFRLIALGPRLQPEQANHNADHDGPQVSL